jgi:hypothetical protein
MTVQADGVIKFEGLTAAPTAVAGGMYYNSTSKQFYVCNDGTNWVAVP